LFFTLQQKLDLFKRLSTGAATKFLTLTILKDIEIICPPINLQCKFSNLASIDLINNLESKNANLRRTRDLLLPKLISGEVDVENIDVRMANNGSEGA
jgi:type I restriction enzyme S subunit